jgi:hypothetical protein
MPCYFGHLLLAGLSTVAVVGIAWFCLRSGKGLDDFLSRIGALITRSQDRGEVASTLLGYGLLWAVVIAAALFGAADSCSL